MDASALLDDAWAALSGPPDARRAVVLDGPAVVLPSRLGTTALLQGGAATVAAAAVDLALARGTQVGEPVVVDSRTACAAGTSERHLRVAGEPIVGFAPLSRFYPCADGGWVRLHGNYPHHRARILRAFDVGRDADVAAALAPFTAREVEERIVEIGGVGAALRTPAEWRAEEAGAAADGAPLLRLSRVGDGAVRTLAPPPAGDGLRPAAGVRVLDLTRVIAGPVATRLLALLGADVLRIDPPGLPEIEVQHLDTGFGKRSAFLDLDDADARAHFDRLLGEADVLVTGYRPGSLARFGLGSEALAERHPSLVLASLGAWGTAGPWAHRRGFDSIVQVAGGIAAVEAHDDGTPGALPAQALDHGTGFLLAAAVLRALAERERTGGVWRAELSLAQTAAWLLRAGVDDAGPAVVPPADWSPWLRETDSYAGPLRYAAPPFTLPDGPVDWATAPVALGSSPAAWR